MSGERKRRTHRHLRISRPAMIESLEERQMLTLTVDVRAADGSKSFVASSVGQVVNLQVWAEITDPQNLPSEDGVQDVGGSFLGTAVGPGPLAGNLSSAVVTPFDANGSQDGTVQDLNGDGNLDAGSNDDSTVVNFFFARSSGAEISGGQIVGNANEFQIGTVTYTVTSLNLGGETDINFRPRNSTTALGAVWVEEGNKINPTDGGTFTAGAPFVVTDPALQPAPTTVDDSASTVLNAPVTIHVLANDPATFAALDASSVKIVTTPADGTASANPDGTIQYIPANGFIGSDSFTYTVNDVNGKTSNAATVTVDTGLGLSSAKGGIKSVTYTDTDGTVATISLNLGQAALAFSGGGTATIKGTKATLGGNNTISGITLSGTSKSSTLTITGKGGDGLVSIASIDDTAPMGKINAPILDLTGTSTLDGLTSLQTKQLNGSTVTIGSGTSSAVSITSPTITGATISAPSETVSLVAGSVASSTISALSDKTVKVTGAFSSSTMSLTSTSISGVLNLNGDVSSSILATNGAFKNLSAGSLTSTTLTSGPIAALHVKGAVTNSNVTFNTATSGPIRITVGGAITGSTISAASAITSVVTASLSGSDIFSEYPVGTPPAPGLAGVTSTDLGTGEIASVHLTGHSGDNFADGSEIIAHTILSASLGTVSTSNGGTPQGLAATTYKSVSLTANGTALHLGTKQLDTSADLASYLTSKSVTFGDFEIDIVTAGA